MKQFLFLTILCLAACKEISFQQPQPNGKRQLSKIPSRLQGNYLLSDPDSPAKDTLFVAFDGYRVGHNKKEKSILGDSIILKYYKGYYFLNINSNPEWLLRVIKQERNGDLIYMDLEEEDNDFPKLIKKISAEIKLDSLEVHNEKLYQINPTPQELVSLINKGYFKKMTLKKIR